MTALLGLLLGLGTGLPVGSLAKPDPLMGTWVLNLAKSSFSPGPLPKSQVAVYKAVPGGVQVTTTGTDAAGRPVNTRYTAMFDGKDYPVTGAEYDMVALTRVNLRSVQLIRKKAGITVQTGTILVALDGKSRTVTVDGVNARGEKLHNVSLYEKQ